MSERDGLKKLIEFLNQTRNQAEQAVDCLNVRINELEQERDAVLGERDYYKNYAEQLRLENSKKWRLQERDDWKALVDSVQKDRSRLQDECHQLEEELSAAYDELHRLEQGRPKDVDNTTADQSNMYDCPTVPSGETQPLYIDDGGKDLDPATLTRNNMTSSSELGDLENSSSLSISLPDSSDKDKDINPDENKLSPSDSNTVISTCGENSPRSISMGAINKLSARLVSTSPTPRRLSISASEIEREPNTNPSTPSPQFQGDGSPRAIVRELRKELAKAHAEIEILKKTAETESLAQEQEINRLREEVRELRERELREISHCESSAPHISYNINEVNTALDNKALPLKHPSKISHSSSQSRISSIWSSPLSVFGYLFSYASAPSTSSSPNTSTQHV